MDITLAILATALLVVQAHRNYLMVKNSSNQSSRTIAAPVVNVEVPEAQIIVSTVQTLDYDKLAEALAKQPAPVITVIQQPAPTYIPAPHTPPVYPSYPNYPTITYGEFSSITADGTDLYTINAEDEPSNVVELNGVPIRRFPSRSR